MNTHEVSPQFDVDVKTRRRGEWLFAVVMLVALQAALIHFGPQLYVWHRVDRWVEYSSYGGWMNFVLSLPLSALKEIVFVLGPECLLWMILMRWSVVKWIRSNQKPKGVSNLHGSARWASPAEVVDMGLLTDRFVHRHSKKPHKGVFVGAYEHEGRTYYLKDDGPAHVLGFAPTRTGKGVGLVIPTALDWRESMFAFDMKGEIWQLTSGWRKREAGQNVFKFEPCGEGDDIAGFNPLGEIRLGTNREVSDAQNIAQMVVDPDAAGITDHWAMTAQALLTAVLLHVAYRERNERGRDATFQDVVKWFGEVGVDLKENLIRMQTYPHVDGQPHALCAQEAQSMLNRPEKERGSVNSSAEKYLTIYRDPIVARNMSRSDFRIRDLMNGDRPASVYFVVSPADLMRLRLVIRLVIMQIVWKLMEEDVPIVDGRPQPKYNHRLLLLLDEFTALKKMASIEDTIPYMASYGLKCYIIVQDILQLARFYGEKQAIASNCHTRVTFQANDARTAKEISDMVGKTTVIKQQFSSSGKRSRLRNESVSTSVSEVQRDLIRPEEVMSLKGAVKNEDNEIVEPGDMLIFSGGQKPIYGKQPLYFKDPELDRRSRIPAPERSDCMDANRNRKRRKRKPEEEPGFPVAEDSAVVVGGSV